MVNSGRSMAIYECRGLQGEANGPYVDRERMGRAVDDLRRISREPLLLLRSVVGLDLRLESVCAAEVPPSGREVDFAYQFGLNRGFICNTSRAYDFDYQEDKAMFEREYVASNHFFVSLSPWCTELNRTVGFTTQNVSMSASSSRRVEFCMSVAKRQVASGKLFVLFSRGFRSLTVTVYS